MRDLKAMKKILLTCFLIHVLAMTLSAQSKVKVTGGFIDDSTRVGDEILFYVTATYNKNLDIVFPDTSFIYTPFEYVSKSYFPTITKDTLSYDSAVFALRTFEIERKQTLRLPVYVVHPSDCTAVYSGSDSVFLRTVVKELPDSITSDLPLKATTAYHDVNKQLNYPYFIVGLSFLALLAALVWVVFGPAISRHYKKKSLLRLHQEFINAYTKHLDDIQHGFDPAKTESAVTLWKKYMERISSRPFTKLTTTETLRMEKDQSLAASLRNLDSAVYGSNNNVTESLQQLQAYAQQKFDNLMTKVNNG
jgi:hypothetical protein